MEMNDFQDEKYILKHKTTTKQEKLVIDVSMPVKAAC